MNLLQLVLSLFVARVLSLALDKIKVPGITAYILTGIVLGPSILAIITDVNPDILVNFSLIFLIFYSGLNVDFKGLRSYLKQALFTTLTGAGITLALTLGVMLYLGFPPIASLVVAISVSNTATEIVVVMLEHIRGISDMFRRVLIMASFLDDLLAIGFIAVIKGSILGNYFSVGIEVLKLVLFLGVVLGAMYMIVRRFPNVIYPLIVNWDYLLMLSSAMLFGLVYVAMKIGVGEIYGAYVAGLSISMFRLVKDPTLLYEVRVEELVSRMSTVLQFFIIPIFFIYVGARTDASLIVSSTTLLVLTLAVIGKFVGASLPLVLKGEYAAGISMGIAMNVRGSIEPAVALIALEKGLISTDIFTAIVSVSLITSAAVPLVFRVISEYVEI